MLHNGGMASQRKETGAKELFELLESLAPFIERKVQMYALGGTALTIFINKNCLI